MLGRLYDVCDFCVSDFCVSVCLASKWFLVSGKMLGRLYDVRDFYLTLCICGFFLPPWYIQKDGSQVTACI